MRRVNYFFITLSVLILSACSPTTKESYLNDYDKFIQDISTNYRSFSDRNWQEKEKTYAQFSGDWYRKFENEFTLREQVKIKANQAKWLYYRNLSDVGAAAKELIETLDVKGLKEQLQFYIDNDMEGDLQTLYNDAVKAGGDAEALILEILKELDVNIEEYQRK